MKYAIIETGGKQYKVSEGSHVKIELVPGQEGQSITFTRVLAYSDGQSTQIGKPLLDQVKVEGSIIANNKDSKVLVFKKKRRKGYSKHFGHRQSYTEVKINSIA